MAARCPRRAWSPATARGSVLLRHSRERGDALAFGAPDLQHPRGSAVETGAERTLGEELELQLERSRRHRVGGEIVQQHGQRFMVPRVQIVACEPEHLPAALAEFLRCHGTSPATWDRQRGRELVPAPRRARYPARSMVADGRDQARPTSSAAFRFRRTWWPTAAR